METSTIFTLVNIATIIIGILQIILFFKIWAMTNDVKKMKDTMCKDGLNQNVLSRRIVELHTMGQDQEAKELLDTNLQAELFKIALDVNNDSEWATEQCNTVKKRYERLYVIINGQMPAILSELSVEKVRAQLFEA